MRKFNFTLAVVSFLSAVSCGSKAPVAVPRKLIISTDNSACNTETIHEVDDGYALLYALRTPGVEVLGVVASHGNTTAEKSWSCSKKLLQMAGREDIPVFKGATSKKELGNISEAVEGMREIVESHPGEVWIVTTGTATDLASFIMNYPDTAQKCAGMVVMAGVIYDTEGLPPVDIVNVFYDVEAVDYVLAHGHNLKIAPLDLTADLVIDHKFWETALKKTTWSPAQYLLLQSQNWMEFMSIIDGGFHPYDVVGLFALFYPNYVEYCETHRLRVDKNPLSPQYTRFIIADDDTSRPQAEIWFDINESVFWETFEKALGIK